MAKDRCAKCNKLITRGTKIVVTPPLYEIALGVSRIEIFHERCAPLEEKAK